MIMAESQPDAPPSPPPRPPLVQRIRPWVELLYRLLAAMAAAIAIWNGLG
jgi:hypothetical protein